MAVKHNHPILIARSDHDRIKQELAFFYFFISSHNKAFQNLMRFEKKLRRATIVENDHVPDGSIMINSRVTLSDVETGDEMDFTLALPAPSRFIENKISVFSPLGCKLIGRKKGDIVDCVMGEGIRKFSIINVDYHTKNCSRDNTVDEL